MQQISTPAVMGNGEARLMGIKELVDNGLQEVPAIYVRPPNDRPTLLSEPDDDRENETHLHQIPVIDLADLVGVADRERRSSVVEKIGRACEEWGFFQVTNHGVEAGIIQRLREAAMAFFAQPAEERMRLHSQRFRSSVGYCTSFNPSLEKVREWRDTLYFNRFPGECDGFQEAPHVCRGPLLEYIDGVERLANLLYSAIFESIGVHDMAVQAGLPTIPRVVMGINYYPPCPSPSLTLGLSGHSDVSCLTILHPDFHVPGLEIRKDNRWVRVKPYQPDAFVVNLADQTEILTNGKYKSIEHRVVTNSNQPRMSIASFFGPNEDTIVAPLSDLLSANRPPLYKPTKFAEYFKNFTTNRLLRDRGTLDFAKF